MQLSEVSAGRRFRIPGPDNRVYLKLDDLFACVDTLLWKAIDFPESFEVVLIPTVIESLYNWISTQTFSDWHNTGRFESHLQDNKPDKIGICLDIAMACKGLGPIG